MGRRADNSFFHESYEGTRVLVAVPHQDDEILTSAAMTLRLTEAGAEVFVVYTTNGDWKYPARVRYREAAEAASRLGIEASHLYFLGYGDSYNNEAHDHLFYYESGQHASTSGHTCTYGAGGTDEYAYMRFGEHHAYNSANYLRDLMSVVREISPDLIICTDFDEHPDHRMLALYMDRAVGLLRREDPSFTPLVWKRLAYALAYTAAADYSATNNPQTLRPHPGITDKYEYDIVDKSIYQWSSRIRIPVPADRGGLQHNVIADALLAHRSQHVITRADRILNSDEVYWERRMDSLGCMADVSATSGDPSYLNDNLLINTQDVDVREEVFGDYCWRPLDSDPDKTATFTWKEPVMIEQILVSGAIDTASVISGLQIEMSDGTVFCTGPLPQTGRPLTVDTGKREGITWCRIRITACEGEAYGISEVQFFESRTYRRVIRPFAKLTVQNNFAYDYYIGMDVKSLRVGCYRYGETGQLKMSVISGRSELRDGILLISEEDSEIVLGLRNRSSTVWDRVVIHRCSNAQMAHRKRIDKADQRYLKLARAYKKTSNMLYILRHQGPGAVVKRTWNNAIKPGIFG